MIECDDPDCKFKWFHFGCVGLLSAPDPATAWFCADCKVKSKAAPESSPSYKKNSK